MRGFGVCGGGGARESSAAGRFRGIVSRRRAVRAAGRGCPWGIRDGAVLMSPPWVASTGPSGTVVQLRFHGAGRRVVISLTSGQLLSL